MPEELFEDRLNNIIESIEIIEKRIGKISAPSDLIIDDEGISLLDGISMRLQHISEIVSKLSVNAPEQLYKIADIDWDKIINFRNFISHHYDLVNHEIIYDICVHELPHLKKVIIEHLNQ